MKNKVKVWIARDKDGSLYAYSINRPIKYLHCWFSSFSVYLGKYKKFSSVQWEDDEPTEAYITLAEPQPKPKKTIDWEQRRYEITKEMMIRKWLSDKIINDRQFPYSKNDDVASAIKCADKLINELKKQSDND